MDSVGGPRGFITGTVALFTVVSGVVAYWNWASLPTFVFDRTLTESIGRVKTELRAHVDDTKKVVLDHADSNTADVKRDVSKVTSVLDMVLRNQKRDSVKTLELQEAQFNAQRSSIQTSLKSIESQLSQKGPNPNRDFLMQRQMELENDRARVEHNIDAVREQLRMAREGN